MKYDEYKNWGSEKFPVNYKEGNDLDDEARRVVDGRVVGFQYSWTSITGEFNVGSWREWVVKGGVICGMYRDLTTEDTIPPTLMPIFCLTYKRGGESYIPFAGFTDEEWSALGGMSDGNPGKS